MLSKQYCHYYVLVCFGVYIKILQYIFVGIVIKTLAPRAQVLYYISVYVWSESEFLRCILED